MDGQVLLPPSADERKGIQPVVEVKVNGGKRADISSGATVAFHAVIQVPENTGKIVSAEWDFNGSGDFAIKVDLDEASVENNGSQVKLTTQHSFSETGTYFPTLRVVAQRQGDRKTPYARIQNLDRVRVVVK